MRSDRRRGSGRISRIESPVGERINATYLVRGTQSSILVDTGLDSTPATVILPFCDAYGVDPGSIRFVLNTHADLDHVGGNASLRRVLPSATFMCHVDDRRQIEDLGAMITERYDEFRPHGLVFDSETLEFWRANGCSTSIDLGLYGGEEIHLGGGWDLEVLATPGHSPGSVSLFDRTGRTLLCGDAVLGDGVLLANGDPAFPPTYRDVEDYLRSIETLAALDLEVLHTAHYPVMAGAAVGAFLELSRAFVVELDRVLESTLRKGGRQAQTLRVLAERIAPQVGSWAITPMALWAFAFPLLGHVERMIARGQVSEIVTDEGASFVWKA